MLNVYIDIRSPVFAPGAGVEEQSRTVELVDFLPYIPYGFVGSFFYLVAYAIHRKRRMVINFIYRFRQKLFGNYRTPRSNHFFEIVVNIVRGTKFYMYENPLFVRNVEKSFARHGRVKSDHIKPEFFCLSYVFAVKFFFRKM